MTRNIMALVFAAVCGICSAGVTQAEQLAAKSSTSTTTDLNYLMYTPAAPLYLVYFREQYSAIPELF